VIGRRDFLRIAAGGATGIALGHPRVTRAQTNNKGKVRLAYLQLGWAGTEIIHKEDLLGKHGWQAEYSVVPGAPGPWLNQLASKNVDAIDMSFALAAKAFEDGVPLRVTGVATAVLGAIIARKDAGLTKVEDLKGKKIAAIVGTSTFQQVTSFQKTLESERSAIVQSVRGMSGILRDTAAATTDFQRSIDVARSSADQASSMANDSAGTFRSMGNSFSSLTFLGLQPLAGFQPQFDRSADQLQQLAISLGSTREALGQNSSDVARVGGDLTSLRAQLDALAISLGQPGVLGFDARGLLPFEIAFYAICSLILVQSVFSIIAGSVLFRLQRALSANSMLALSSKTATTNGVLEEACRARTS